MFLFSSQRKMKKIINFAHKELIHILRDKRSFLLTLFFPFFVVVFLGYAITLDVRKVKMCVLDEDGIIAYSLKKKLEGSPYFELMDVENLKEAEDAIRNGNVKLCLYAKKGLTREFLGKGDAKISVILDGSDNNSANIAFSYLYQAFDEFLMSKGLYIKNRLNIKYLFNNRLSSSNFFIPGLIGIFVFIICVAMTSISVVREKEFGTIESLLVAPVKAYQFIGGKLITYVVIALLDFLIAIISAHIFFGFRVEGSFFTLFLFTGIFALCGVSIGLFISSLTQSTMVAWLISFIISFLPSMILSDFVFPTKSMAKPIELFSYIVPAKYYIKIIRFIAIKGAGIKALWPDVLVLFCFSLLFFSISFKRAIK